MKKYIINSEGKPELREIVDYTAVCKARTPKAETTPKARTPKAKQEQQNNANFEQLKRTFENAYMNGEDYAAPLYALATACASSVVKKLCDPQRKTAHKCDAVSNSGLNPAMLDLRRGIQRDNHLLEDTKRNNDLATHIRFTDDGTPTNETADKDAAAAIEKLMEETLSDGIDLVQTAVAAILEQAADHAAAANWLDTPYTVRRLARKVYIRLEDSAEYREEDTTPMQEVYRTIRRVVETSRAVQTDPRNGYLYLEDFADDENGGLDVIYRRMQKWADLGGVDRDGHYTADLQTAVDYNSVLAALNLTDRQLTIIHLRMQGYGYAAIGTYLGVSMQAVHQTLKKVQVKCEKVGFTPAMWQEMGE